MGIRAKAIRTLYRAGRIDVFGVRKAVKEHIITAAEYETITGTDYVA